ncbi:MULTISPECIES: sulfatase [unclassified Imperialibacter]|uniref:sulfatase n=1 Tax=unclassified Imperialibacter TaxID=2629706 RepID=UPI00125C910D|nr:MULTISPECIES: sulfatase [unclassified Imperialibacter]CAD5293187.1 Iduronate sulfatase [Imperialibacter sp. 89]CAD5294278.1 Iduronate sulfatase [Imperialibacter sp. 75]VVT18441.1 Iduronate sulfatase [Imperialibacter sp. EC-SDR9]
MTYQFRSLVIPFLGASLVFSCTPKEAPTGPSNVLFIVVDDLRPELGCYGHPLVQSPNMDQLAGEGVLFKNAFCNIPVCGASRASFLTGLRPMQNRFLTYLTYAQDDAPGAISLPQYFKDNGYTTVSNGKVFHNEDDHAAAWDINWRPNDLLDYQTEANSGTDLANRGRPYERGNVPDSVYNDAKIAAKSIIDLKALAAAGKPFFMAVGFLKPHLPFNAPEKYWQLYDGKVSLPDNNYVPTGAPARSVHNSGELRNYAEVPKEGPVSDSLALTLIQGYYASVSYVDAQIGRVLDELKALGLDEKTHIVLIGDHGYNLLEHTMWCKHCNYRNSLRSTMIWKSPKVKAGSISNAIVEYVDIFPTLADLSGLPKPTQLQGESLANELAAPSTSPAGFAISRWTNGYTITTPDYAYTEWVNDSLQWQDEMLYDHRSDLEENENIAAGQSAIADSLSHMLRQHWGLQ